MTHYDRDRAARSGGFAEDLAYGRSIAEIVYLTARIAVQATAPVDAQTIIASAVAGVADELHHSHPDVTEDPTWLAAMHVAVTDMYRDLIAQIEDVAPEPLTPGPSVQLTTRVGSAQ